MKPNELVLLDTATPENMSGVRTDTVTPTSINVWSYSQIQGVVFTSNISSFQRDRPASTGEFDPSIEFSNTKTKRFSKAAAASFTQTSSETISPKVNPRSKIFDAHFQTFRRMSRAETLEYGSVSGCDRLIELWSSDSGLDFGGVINYIFLKSVGNKTLLLALLKAVSSVPYDSVHPYAPVQAMAALVIKDFEVAEAGIRAFENWGHADGIDILTNVKMPADWLDDYREETISYLKGL